MPGGGESGGEPNPPPENKLDAEKREMALKSKSLNCDKNVTSKTVIWKKMNNNADLRLSSV